MATTFAALRDLIRAAVQDHDPVRKIYSDNALNSQIRFTNLQLESPAPYTEDVGETFEEDITNKEQIRLSLKTAIRLLSGQPNEFSYTSPSLLAVSRKGGVSELRMLLEESLSDIEGGVFALETETEFTDFIQRFDRFINEYDAAYRAWPGNT